MRNRTGWIGTLLGAAVVGGILLGTTFIAWAQNAQPKDQNATQEELRAIWVSAPSVPLADPGAAERMVKEVRSAKFNTIIVQVEALGTAYYETSVLPEAASLTPANPDPLGWILQKVNEAPSQGAAQATPLKVVAALDLLRVFSRTLRSRPAPDSILGNHPGWATLNQAGKDEGPDHYVSLEPGLEPVRAFLAQEISNLVSNYDVDGVFLDGLRYPGTKAEWGYHPAVLQMFHQAYPDASMPPKPTDPDWVKFRRNILETLVSDLAGAVHRTRPDCQVFVGAEVVDPAPTTFEEWDQGPVATGMLQDWVQWGRDGIVDWICLKNLQTGGIQGNQFDAWLSLASRAKIKTPMCVGILGSQNFNTQILNQIWATETAGFGGILLYDYANPTAEDRTVLLSHLGNTVFAQKRQMPKLLNITYVPRATQSPTATPFTTPTLITASPASMKSAAPATTGTLEPVMTPMETQAPPTPTEAATPTPEPTPPPPTPTALAAPMQTFRLRNGLSFKGRVVVEVEGKVTILTEDGTQLKIAKNQIVSPHLSESTPAP